MEFDLDTLEKALSAKSRRPRQDLSPEQSKSKQELYDEAKRLDEEYYDIYSKRLYTRSRGVFYHIIRGELCIGDYTRVDDIGQVPRKVFEQLVANGRRRLKNYHEMLNTVIMQNPEMALEANLEGKTGSELIEFAYDKRVGQIENLFNQRVSSSRVNFFLRFNITMKPPLGQEFSIEIAWWSNRSPSVSGINLHPTQQIEIVKLVHFLTYFEQVTDEINRQLDTIEVRKEVIK